MSAVRAVRKRAGAPSGWVALPGLHVHLRAWPDPGSVPMVLRAVEEALREIGIPVERVTLTRMMRRGRP